MPHDHASFFSGVGGLDMGLERAGWRTVSFSEIDPYASAVLAERWPGVPNLGDITDLARRDGTGGEWRVGSRTADGDALVQPDERSSGRAETRRAVGAAADSEWHRASLWTGGFPCQDLSVAGKRRGMGAGTRSGLAFAFLDLAAVHRPRFILLENVPGLLSSHGGRDMAALVGALVQLGYGVGYRVLDARYFGVPQRRRRVFILGITPGGRAGAECAAEVLSVGSRCRRHPPTGIEAGEGAAAGAPGGPRVVGPLDTALGHHGAGWPDQSVAAGHLIANGLRASDGHHGYSSPRGDGGDNIVLGASPDPGRVRAADGLAGRLDDRGGVAVSENQRGEVLLTEIAHQLTAGGGKPGQGYSAVLGRSGVSDDPLLPLGLDSHRYRCCGNGVVADVAFWIGERLAAIA